MLARPEFAAVFAAPLLAALVLSASTANADEPGAVLARYDLAGTWAPACDKPPGPANWYVIHSVTPNGRAENRYNNGDGGPLRLSIVESAQPLTATTLGVRTRYADSGWGSANGAVFDMIVEVAAGHSRTVQSIRNDGTILIKDSKFAMNGEPSQILYKCSGGSNA
jgi:hypothetical protein